MALTFHSPKGGSISSVARTSCHFSKSPGPLIPSLMTISIGDWHIYAFNVNENLLTPFICAVLAVTSEALANNGLGT